MLVIQPWVSGDGIDHQVCLRLLGVEHPCSLVQRFGRDLKPAGDLLENLCGGLAQAAFNLRQVRIRNSRALGKVAYRLLRNLSLLANERTNVRTFASRHFSAAFVKQGVDARRGGAIPANEFGRECIDLGEQFLAARRHDEFEVRETLHASVDFGVVKLT